MTPRNSVSWSWTARDGSKNTVGFDVTDLSIETLAQARAAAEMAGYPGHRGGWWNYLVDDIAKLLGTER